DAKSMGVTPLALTGVAPGEHLLVIEKQDYRTVRRTLNAGPSNREIIDLNLMKLTGFLVVHSRPQGAEVSINDASVGVTPVLVTDLALGTYRVKLIKSGFLPKDVEIKLDTRIPMKRVIDLISNTATIELESLPSIARVLLNGADRGLTPLTLEGIPSGKIVLEISRHGYQTYRQEMALDVGQMERIRAVLTPIPSVLEIITVPPAARIYIDDQFRGMSPLVLTDIAPEEYSIRAEREGFEDFTRNVIVPQAASVVEELRMTQISGALEITTEPAGVSVLIDGKLVGVSEAGADVTDRISSPLRIDYIEEGDHSLQLTKLGYFEIQTDFTVERQETLNMHHALKRRFIPNYEVVTDKGLVTGMFHEIDSDGAIRLEVSPGVIRTIRQSEIKLRRALRGENIPPPE
ncbi:MAG: PEGA domain-containing protein, partial [Verrucomicrobia bacterium]|nr:PEGA domain-containing protein [Verrucomicrobiota bacterium]